MKATEQRSAGSSEAEAAIRSLTEQWGDAVRNRDFDAIVSHYSDEVTVFDVPPPLRIIGKAAYRRNLKNWLNMFDGPVEVEFKDMTIQAGDCIAFLHTLTRVTAKSAGPESGTWVRATVCYEKIDGRWLVTHEHVSIPFNGQSSITNPNP